MKRYIKSAIAPLTDYNWKDLYEIASDPNTSVEVLEEMAGMADSSVVLNAILANENITSTVIEKMTDRILLFIGSDRDVLERIATHPKTSKDTLAKIVSTAMEELVNTYSGCAVLIAIAKNPNASLTTLRKLSNCPDLDVRCAVAKNPSTSPAILKHMIHIDAAVLYHALLNPNMPMDLLIKLSKANDHWTREGVAANSNTPPEILASMVNDESYYVRDSLAENINTPIETLKILTKDDEWLVAEHARDTLRALGAR